jgi:hypothetical protein
MSFNGGGDQLARGAKSATFKQAAFDKDGRNSHGQSWEEIFGETEKKPARKEKKKKSDE